MPAPMIKWGMDITKIPAPVQASLEPIVRFFSFHDAHPVALTMTLMEKFGVDWIEWEPETLKSETIKAFNATSISEHNWQKIEAVRTLLLTYGAWNEWHIFEKIVQALNNNIPRFDITQRCSLAQLMAGVDIINTLRKEEFGDEIQRYIAACAIDQGVTYLPAPLEFAQNVLSQPMYRCKVCGNTDTDDLDGRCDFCTGRFEDDRPLNFQPMKEAPDNAGRDLEKFMARDPEPARERFEEVMLKGPDNVTFDEENTEDVQAAKLVVATKYMEKRRQQLVEQLEELKSWVTH